MTDPPGSSPPGPGPSGSSPGDDPEKRTASSAGAPEAREHRLERIENRLVLFLKWAYQRNLISYEVRTGLGLLVGLVLVTFGEVLHRRAARYSEAFTGAGVAAFYATFFAAYQLYHLFGQTSSFALMVATTV